MRAESCVTRDSASAPMMCADGIVSPISVLRMTMSFGRTSPPTVASTSTHTGVTSPASDTTISTTASAT
jgi:hypothetical protein